MTNSNEPRTEVLYGYEDISNAMSQFISKVVHTLYICAEGQSVGGALQTYKGKLLDLKSRGVMIRFITEVTKDNLLYCKEMNSIVDLRHIDGIKAGFAVSEIETITNSLLQGSQPVPQLIYSNAKIMIEQQQYLFEALWQKSIPAEQKIREIDEGIEREFLEIITDSEIAAEVIVDLAKSVEHEALLFLPVSKALNRLNKMGLFDHLVVASNKKGALIKIICPISNENYEIIKRIRTDASNIRILEGNISTYSMFIVDGTRLFSAEAKNPDADEFSKAIAFPIYSNSKQTVQVFKSFFDLLWKENTLIANFRTRDKMQSEFINVTSHELKTPTQAILSFSELLQTHPEKIPELIEGIRRNANRLQRLSNNITVLTRIEGQTLNLSKEHFNFTEYLRKFIDGIRTQIVDNKGIDLLFIAQENAESIFVDADREKIYQVICNLIDNSISFTREGTISISVEKRQVAEDGKVGEVLVSIRDTGTGIDSEILPQIFSKFTTKSYAGIGLGLFVSKAIIESHGGRIWAKNNTDGRQGTTFYFSLPLSR